MKITKQARRGAKELLRSCTADGRLDENRVREAVQRVIQNKPRGYLAVLSHFERLLKLAIDQRTARIESATALPQDLRAKLQAELTRAYGPGLHLSFTENPSLLGGLRIKVGSDVYDGTVQGRLAALQESF
jgi:F-type H+-transporting ATPase subunit delta